MTDQEHVTALLNAAHGLRDAMRAARRVGLVTTLRTDNEADGRTNDFFISVSRVVKLC